MAPPSYKPGSRGSLPHSHSSSIHPVTSPAGPTRPAAALSLRVREALCPPRGPPGPWPLHPPAPRGRPGGTSPAAPNRRKPRRRPDHIWLRFAVILASPHHLTIEEKKQQPVKTRPSPPPPSTSPELAPAAQRPGCTYSPGQEGRRARHWLGPGPQHPEQISPVEGALHSPPPQPTSERTGGRTFRPQAFMKFKNAWLPELHPNPPCQRPQQLD